MAMEAGDIVYYKDWDENLIVLGESNSKRVFTDALHMNLT